MKKSVYLFTALLVCLLTSSVQAAVDIYVKITDANNTVITQGASVTVTDGPSNRIDLKDYMAVTSVQYAQEQTLNISNQGTGAGTITFNPFVLTKTADIVSAKLMQYQAAGTLLNTIEILFVHPSAGSTAGRVFQKIVLGTALVNTYAVSSIEDCGNGCPPVAESISFACAVMKIFTYTQSNNTNVPDSYHYSWSRITNAEEP